jgi:type II secretory pathway pseudopilin PulG
LIVIPRLLGAGRKAKEASLRGDLHQLRNALQQFEADCGDYPANLSDIMQTKGWHPSGVGGSGVIMLDENGYQGPYLHTADGALPADPFTATADWVYAGTEGSVHSNSTLTALDGTSYSAW